MADAPPSNSSGGANETDLLLSPLYSAWGGRHRLTVLLFTLSLIGAVLNTGILFMLRRDRRFRVFPNVIYTIICGVAAVLAFSCSMYMFVGLDRSHLISMRLGVPPERPVVADATPFCLAQGFFLVSSALTLEWMHVVLAYHMLKTFIRQETSRPLDTIIAITAVCILGILHAGLGLGPGTIHPYAHVCRMSGPPWVRQFMAASFTVCFSVALAGGVVCVISFVRLAARLPIRRADAKQVSLSAAEQLRILLRRCIMVCTYISVSAAAGMAIVIYNYVNAQQDAMADARALATDRDGISTVGVSGLDVLVAVHPLVIGLLYLIIFSDVILAPCKAEDVWIATAGDLGVGAASGYDELVGRVTSNPRPARAALATAYFKRTTVASYYNRNRYPVSMVSTAPARLAAHDFSPSSTPDGGGGDGGGGVGIVIAAVSTIESRNEDGSSPQYYEPPPGLSMAHRLSSVDDNVHGIHVVTGSPHARHPVTATPLAAARYTVDAKPAAGGGGQSTPKLVHTKATLPVAPLVLQDFQSFSNSLPGSESMLRDAGHAVNAWQEPAHLHVSHGTHSSAETPRSGTNPQRPGDETRPLPPQALQQPTPNAGTACVPATALAPPASVHDQNAPKPEDAELLQAPSSHELLADNTDHGAVHIAVSSSAECTRTHASSVPASIHCAHDAAGTHTPLTGREAAAFDATEVDCAPTPAPALASCNTPLTVTPIQVRTPSHRRVGGAVPGALPVTALERATDDAGRLVTPSLGVTSSPPADEEVPPASPILPGAVSSSRA